MKTLSSRNSSRSTPPEARVAMTATAPPRPENRREVTAGGYRGDAVRTSRTMATVAARPTARGSALRRGARISLRCGSDAATRPRSTDPDAEASADRRGLGCRVGRLPLARSLLAPRIGAEAPSAGIRPSSFWPRGACTREAPRASTPSVAGLRPEYIPGPGEDNVSRLAPQRAAAASIGPVEVKFSSLFCFDKSEMFERSPAGARPFVSPLSRP